MKNAIIPQNEWGSWRSEDFRRKTEDLKKVKEIRVRVTGKYSEEYAKAYWWGEADDRFQDSAGSCERTEDV